MDQALNGSAELSSTDAYIELWVRRRLRHARQIVEAELGEVPGEVLAAVFEQMCFHAQQPVGTQQLAH